MTHSTGPIELRQTWLADFDSGREVNNVPSADIWFQAETERRLFLVPRNGAEMAVGDRSNRGRNGCRDEVYSAERVSLWTLPVGSYVCMRTNEGRISQFRINGLTPDSPRTLSLGYTTWRN